MSKLSWFIFYFYILLEMKLFSIKKKKKKESFRWKRDIGGHGDGFPFGALSLLCDY